jgi:hypothetical protein
VTGLDELIFRGRRLAAARAAGQPDAATRQALEIASMRARAAEIANWNAAGSRRAAEALAAQMQAAMLAAGELEREHPGARVEAQRLRDGWGLAATVNGWPSPGGRETVAGPVAEVRAWLDAVRLGREHPAAGCAW